MAPKEDLTFDLEQIKHKNLDLMLMLSLTFQTFYCFSNHNARDVTHWDLFTDDGPSSSAFNVCGN